MEETAERLKDSCGAQPPHESPLNGADGKMLDDSYGQLRSLNVCLGAKHIRPAVAFLVVFVVIQPMLVQVTASERANASSPLKFERGDEVVIVVQNTGGAPRKPTSWSGVVEHNRALRCY